LVHPALDSNQQWADLDRRGNWLDHRWNRQDIEGSSLHQEAREANGVNEYTEVTWGQIPYEPTHDAAGNLTMDPWAPNVGFAAASSQWYEYDEENRVTAVRKPDGPDEGSEPDLVAEYEYDALGRRVHSTEYIDPAIGATLATPKKTRHVYVGIETVEEYDVTGISSGRGTLLREFVWGDPGRFPEPLAMLTHDGAGNCVPGEPGGPCVFHYLHDALGSVIGLTDSTVAMVERYMYDPYGRTYAESWDPTANEGAGGWIPNIAGGATGGYSPICYSAFGNPWMWTGQRYDAATGLYAFLYRTYSPSLGRWLQRDSEEYVDGVNLYEYVRSRPIGAVDPLGLECCQFPGGGSTDSVGGICPNDPGNPWDFEEACKSAGGTYSTCDCVPNSQGCPLRAPGTGVGDGWCKEYFYNPYHRWPGGNAGSCYRGLGANSGAQCCYSDSGCLIGDGDPGAGSADTFPPSATEDQDGDCNSDGDLVGHFMFEMTPIGNTLIDLALWLGRLKEGNSAGGCGGPAPIR
jgi:RHS repeat-associated protein